MGKKTASSPSTPEFTSSVCGSQWDLFIASWMNKSYIFVEQSLGAYQKQPKKHVLPLHDSKYTSGVNACYNPSDGQIRLSRLAVEGESGVTLEKITHELIHASLSDFPEGDPFYEEGAVDYMVLVMAHSPFWEPYRSAMVTAARRNLELRRDRALKTRTDYTAKRWYGACFMAETYGPWIVERFREKKLTGELVW